MRRAAPWIGILARLVVGGVWLVAGLLKLPDPAQNVRSVRAYQLLPEAVVPTLGHLLPVLEVLVGVCLLLGVLTRFAAVLSALMLAAFVVGISSAWSRGLAIECGCFGGGAGPTVNATAAYRHYWLDKPFFALIGYVPLGLIFRIAPSVAAAYGLLFTKPVVAQLQV